MSDENEIKELVVRLGYDQDLRPVSFRGRELCVISTRTTQGPNQNRWHEYVLFKTPKGFRVLDSYCTQWEGESGHTKMSEQINAKSVMMNYPRIANEAVDRGFIDEKDVRLTPEEYKALQD